MNIDQDILLYIVISGLSLGIGAPIIALIVYYFRKNREFDLKAREQTLHSSSDTI